MSHLPPIMIDLAMILISAGIITLIFKWLKQPLVLGYIVAGVIAGPYIHLPPTISDIDNIRIWGEIGVVFLLFALGLEFSFKKLMRVGGTALIAAMTEVISMLLIGIGIGHALGWPLMDSIFLGGMLSMSSTTIIIKAFDDLGLRNQKFTGIVFGVLVVEDLVAILMMVLLSTMAGSSHFEGEAMLESILKVIFFLILWFLIGIFLLPWFFQKVKKLMNDETLLIISLGLCLGMVVVATNTGFSSALGAFIMGSILAETIEAEHIEQIITPVKNLFGAIFFVSVGMMVDPAVLADYALPIVVITLTTIIGKAIFSTSGVLLSGQPLSTSIQSGFSLAQIGEFAFIIAALGVSLGVLDNYIYPIIVTVSVITTFSTPYMIHLSAPFANWLQNRLPRPVLAALKQYSSGSRTANHENEWKTLIRIYTEKVILVSVIIIAIILISFQYIDPAISKMIPDIWGKVLTAGITLMLMAPFLRALILNKSYAPELFNSLWSDSKYNKGGLVSLVLFRIFLATLFVSIVIFHLFRLSDWIGIIIALAIVSIIFVSRRLLNQYTRIENRFLENFNEREEAQRKRSPFRSSFTSQLQNKNIHLTNIVVSADSPYIGKTLAELNFRMKFGISIVKIFRGCHQINIPDGKEYIYPQDKLLIVGTDEQLAAFIFDIESTQEILPAPANEVVLKSFIIDSLSPLIGLSILDADMNKCLIVGIDRDNTSIMNPDHSVTFENGDLIWIAGEKDNVEQLIKINSGHNSSLLGAK